MSSRTCLGPPGCTVVGIDAGPPRHDVGLTQALDVQEGKKHLLGCRAGPPYRAPICKRLRSPRIDTKESICRICRTDPLGYIGWRNRLLGIDSWAP
jgi:hypothetical protein